MGKPFLSDALWEIIEPLLPPRLRGGRGRPPVADRHALMGILFVLRSGIPWEDLPEEMGCGSGMTCLRRLRDWQRIGIWPVMQDLLQAHWADGRRVNWSRAQITRTRPASRLPAPSTQGTLLP